MTDPRDRLIENLTALLAQTPDSYADKDWRQRRRALLDEVGRWKEGRDQIVRTSIRFYESEGHEVTARALREAKAPGRLFKAQKLDDQVEYRALPGPDVGDRQKQHREALERRDPFLAEVPAPRALRVWCELHGHPCFTKLHAVECARRETLGHPGWAFECASCRAGGWIADLTVIEKAGQAERPAAPGVAACFYSGIRSNSDYRVECRCGAIWEGGEVHP